MKKNSTIASINTDDYNRFNKFLRKHGAFFNYYASSMGCTVILKRVYNISDNISGAFVWSQTKQGEMYWINLSKIWQAEVRND